MNRQNGRALVRVLVWSGVTLAVLFALFIVTGYFVPKSYTGAAQLMVTKSPEAVWEALQDYEKFPIATNPKIKVSRLPDQKGLPVWQEDMGHTKITVITVESQAPNRLVRALSDSDSTATSRWEFAITPVQNGCTLRIQESMSVQGNSWYDAFFRTIVWMNPNSGVKAYLERMAEDMGESAKVEKVPVKD